MERCTLNLIMPLKGLAPLHCYLGTRLLARRPLASTFKLYPLTWLLAVQLLSCGSCKVLKNSMQAVRASRLLGAGHVLHAV